jgi:hypothetical protein
MYEPTYRIIAIKGLYRSIERVSCIFAADSHPGGSFEGFYAAEDYHQDYLLHNPSAPYIAMFDMPKIENFKRIFPELYSGRPVSVRNGFRP